YNSMNQAFLVIVVKILGAIFTIPTRFVDLLWPATERTQRPFLGLQFIAYECQSKSMQRIPRLSLALLSTLAASSTALAGPLSLNPTSQRSAPPIAAIYDTTPAAPPARAAAQRSAYGGGFIEFLFGGPSG